MQIAPRNERSSLIRLPEGEDVIPVMIKSAKEGRTKGANGATVKPKLTVEFYATPAPGQLRTLTRDFIYGTTWFDEFLDAFAPEVTETGGALDPRTLRGRCARAQITVRDGEEDGRGGFYPPKNEIPKIYPVAPHEAGQILGLFKTLILAAQQKQGQPPAQQGQAPPQQRQPQGNVPPAGYTGGQRAPAQQPPQQQAQPQRQAPAPQPAPNLYGNAPQQGAYAGEDMDIPHDDQFDQNDEQLPF